MQPEEKKTPEPKKPRGQGVPFGLVALLVVLALACGGALGYVGGVKFSGVAKELKQAQAVIDDYELALLEIYSDEFEKVAAKSESEFGDASNAVLAGADPDVADETEPVIVAEFAGGTIMSDEAIEEYHATLASYALEGTDVTENAAAILDTVLENLIGDKVAYLKAEERGYTQLTDADRAQIADQAQAEFDDTVEFYIDIVREEGMTDEEAYDAAVKYLADFEGYTIDAITQNTEDNWWYQKLYDEVVSGVSVTAEEINAAYNELVAAQQAQFSEAELFEQALLGGDMIVYIPEGYRNIKHIYLELSEDAQARAFEIAELLETETDAAEIEKLNKELDELYAPAEAEAADIREMLAAGGDFTELMREYSQDDELLDGTFASTGYYVSANSVMWSEAFREASMTLENTGDISEPVRSEGGVHIILYTANVAPGPVPLSKVNAEMTEATLESKRFETYQRQLQTWIAEMDVRYYPERILEQE